MPVTLLMHPYTFITLLIASGRANELQWGPYQECLGAVEAAHRLELHSSMRPGSHLILQALCHRLPPDSPGAMPQAAT